MRPSELGAAAALLVAAATARGAAPGCDLEVSASPRDLVLGSGARAVVRVAAPSTPELSASAGELGPVREVTPGVWEAELRPPRELYPSIAIVSAITGQGCGFTAVLLHGRAEAIARGEPGAEVAVEVADRTFGPVRADARGGATVPVVVPPGVATARHDGKELPLPPAPPVRHVHAALHRRTATADQDVALPVRLFAVTDSGAPRAAAPVEVAVSEGTVDPPVETGPGALLAWWRLQRGAPREATLTVGMAGEPPRAQLRVALVTGVPARVAVAPARVRATAGEEPIEIALEVLDAAGNPVDVAPAVRTTFGALAPLERVAHGRWRSALALPARLEDRSSAVVDAVAADCAGRAEIELGPAAAAAVDLEVPGAVVADGRQSAPIRVAIRDRFGNVVRGERPRLDADTGEITGGDAGGDGTWAYRFRPVRRLEPATAELRVSAAGVRRDAIVPLAPPRPWIWVAPRAGWAYSRSGSGAAAALSVEAWDRVRDTPVGIAIEVGRAALDRRASAPLEGGHVALRARTEVTSVGAAATWYRPLPRVAPGAAVWASAGLGLSYLRSEVSVGSQPATVDGSLAPRAEASIAAGMRAWHGFGFVEARAGVDAGRRLSNFAGSLSTFTLAAGYRYDAR